MVLGIGAIPSSGIIFAAAGPPFGALSASTTSELGTLGFNVGPDALWGCFSRVFDGGS
jgi:hypothetical protein